MIYMDKPDKPTSIAKLRSGGATMSNFRPTAPMPLMDKASFLLQPAKLSLDAYARGDLPEALEQLYKAERMAPHVPEYKATIAVILHEMARYTEALEWHKKAIALKVTRPEIYSNYGNTLRALGMLQEAHHWNWRALRKDQNNSMVWNNQGCVDTELADIPEAIRCFNRAIDLDPRNYVAYFNRGNARLLSGDYSVDAWEDYDFRGLTKMATQQFLPFPWWVGEELNGKKLFIEVEQGAGDTFQFCRFLYPLKERYPEAQITFQVADPLFDIMRENFGSLYNVVPGVYTIAEPYDYRLMLMHLGRVFPGYTGFSPYLCAPEKAPLRNGKFSVGLCWKGNPDHKNDHNRSIHNFSTWADLLTDIPGAQFFSLQKDCELPNAPAFPLPTWVDTFNMIRRLNLVITVDTSVAHVAGAMGKRVWLMLPKSPDWRWGLESETSRWYPSMKIYRQPLRGRWDIVIEKVSEDLAALVSGG